MIGSLLYWVTAAITLAGYEFLQVIGSPASDRPPVASHASAAAPACALLVVAGLLNLWKPRFGGIVALLGSLLIWSVLLSPIQLSAFFYFLSHLAVVYVLPVGIIAILAGMTTIYAGLAALGAGRFGVFPAWLFPQPIRRASDETKRQSPATVRVAAVLLYCWLAILGVFLIQAQWRGTGFAVLFVWILDLAILAALLWVIIATSDGKNWARITLVIIYALTVRGLIMDLAQGSESRLMLTLAITECLIFSVAIALLFSGASAIYFKKPVLPK